MRKINKILKSMLVLAVIAATLLCSLSVTAAETFKDYKENTGTLAVIANFDKTGEKSKGKVDELGKEYKDPGTGSEDWKKDVGTLNMSYDTTHFLQGDASIKMNIPKTEVMGQVTSLNKTTLQVRNFSGVTVPSNISNVYLCFYLYVEKKAQFDYIDLPNSQIEIANNIDVSEYNFSYDKIAKQVKNDGWNKIQLSFKDAGKEGVTGAMSFKVFRSYIFSKGTNDVDIYLDNVTLEYIGEPEEDKNTTQNSGTVSSEGFNVVGAGKNPSSSKESSSNNSSSSKKPATTLVDRNSSASSGTKEEEKGLTDEEIAEIVAGIADGTITDISKYTDDEKTKIKDKVAADHPDLGAVFNDDGTVTIEEESDLILWIIIGAAAVIVVAGVAVAAILLLKKKPAPVAQAAAAPAEEAAPEAPSEDSAE